MFKEKYQKIINEFNNGKTMVLSSSYNNEVSSRMMSIVEIDNCFYFQTDCNFRKYKQLLNNQNVALCIDNIQIEGICEKVGKPIDNLKFCETFKRCFKGSFEAYTSLNSEVLFCVKPKYIQRWLYIDKIPYIEKYDIDKERYEIVEYKTK